MCVYNRGSFTFKKFPAEKKRCLIIEVSKGCSRRAIMTQHQLPVGLGADKGERPSGLRGDAWTTMGIVVAHCLMVSSPHVWGPSVITRFHQEPWLFERKFGLTLIASAELQFSQSPGLGAVPEPHSLLPWEGGGFQRSGRGRLVWVGDMSAPAPSDGGS